MSTSQVQSADAPSTPDLVLLGLLMDQPLHGYELRRLVAERMSHVARIPPGTIYYTLKKLEKRGLVRHSTERAGNRPERRVYTITAAGREVFTTLLREAVLIDERPYSRFDVALYFYPHLDRSFLLDAVENKLAGIEKFNQRVQALEDAYPGKWPFHLFVLKKKAHLLTDALDDWYTLLRDGLRRRTGAVPAASRPARSTRRKEIRP